MYFTYVQRSLKNKLYKGHTSNITRRRMEHLMCKSPSSKRMGPSVLVYFEIFGNKTDAIIREKFFKSGKGRSLLKQWLKRRSAPGGL